jgi:hypothetical protein
VKEADLVRFLSGVSPGVRHQVAGMAEGFLAHITAKARSEKIVAFGTTKVERTARHPAFSIHGTVGLDLFLEKIILSIQDKFGFQIYL